TLETCRRSRRNKVCCRGARSSHRQEDDLVALLLCSMDALADDRGDVATVESSAGWAGSGLAGIAPQLQLDLLAGLRVRPNHTDGALAWEPDPGLLYRIGCGVETL